MEALQNIPKSSIKGVEGEVVARPVRELTLRAALTYLDGKVKTFTGINTVGVVSDFSGTRLPYTPKMQGAFDGEYRTDISNSLYAYIGTNVNFRSKSTAIIGGELPVPAYVGPYSKPFSLKGYTLVDLRLGVGSKEQGWNFQVWGKNVFNQYYYNNISQVYDVTVRYAGVGATYGATIGYHF